MGVAEAEKRRAQRAEKCKDFCSLFVAPRTPCRHPSPPPWSAPVRRAKAGSMKECKLPKPTARYVPRPLHHLGQNTPQNAQNVPFFYFSERFSLHGKNAVLKCK